MAKKTPGVVKLQTAAMALSPDDQRKLYYTLRAAIYPAPTTNPMLVTEIREKRFQDGFSCPYCQTTQVIRYGKYDGKQRYQCKTCKCTFGDFTGSPLARTKKPDKWQDFLECMIEGRTLRDSGIAIGVHYVTLFYWRHKVMKALKSLPPPKLTGVGESDETYQRESQKGSRCIEGRPPHHRGGPAKSRGIGADQVCTVVARDRHGSTLVDIAGFGQLSEAKANATLREAISGVTVLCSDSASAYFKLAKSLNIEHVVLNASKKIRKRGIYHIQNVNGYHSRLKGWLLPFKGVATKYLNSYQALFDFVDRSRSYDSDAKRKKLLMEACQSSVVPPYKALRLVRFPAFV
jgi:transposase-like protein